MLSSFDTCEDLLKSDSLENIKNQCNIKMTLAHIYWSLGEEYFHLSVEKINKAWDLHRDNSFFTEEERYRLINNRCWYHLEIFLTLKKDDKDYVSCYEKLSKSFRALEDVILDDGSDIIHADMYDTAAWFHYNVSYIKNYDLDNLEKAGEYCGEIETQINKNKLSLLAASMYKNHMQLILKALKKEGLMIKPQ